MPTIRIWAVIGPSNAGKSSTIGALASFEGRSAGGVRDVILSGGGRLRIHAYRQSVQEAGLTPKESTIQNATRSIFKRREKSNYIANFLLALRSDNVGSLPTAEEYLSHYLKIGWALESLVLLDMPGEYENYASFGVPVCEIPESTKLTSTKHSRNWVFARARNHFGWA